MRNIINGRPPFCPYLPSKRIIPPPSKQQQQQSRLHLPLSRIRSSDAVVVLYSIVDRNSFEAARLALAKIGEEKETMLNGRDDEVERREDPVQPAASVSGVGSALAKASRLPLVTLLGNKTDLAHLREA